MKMYKTYVPIMAKKYTDREKMALVKELKRAKADLVFAAYRRTMGEKSAELLDEAEECVDFLKKEGFNVGIWVAPTIGYGGDGSNSEKAPYERITTLEGNKVNAYCPLDEGFADELSAQFSRIAKMNITHILLEDDFTVSGGKFFLSTLACTCPRHTKLLSERLGKSITKEELREKLLTGGRNEVRSAFCDIMGDTLRSIARKIERAVHLVSPDIKIGTSANSASYHIEGASFFELTKIFAGKNRPFCRITGAPYWKNGPSLNSTIEAARWQSAFAKKNGIDVMTEGDTYPRPRFLVSASELEMYDMALRADGNSNAILKYMLDYNSRADYETGYVDRHVKNLSHYAEIEKRFSGLEAKGLYVFEEPHTVKDMDFSDVFGFAEFTSHGVLPLMSSWLVTDNSVPTSYEKTDGAVLAWGTSAQFLTEEELSKGVILDAVSAKILSERGIDVGFEKMESTKKPDGEYFFDDEDQTIVLTPTDRGFFRFKLKDGANVKSAFYCSEAILGVAKGYSERTDEFPACYTYENNDGQRFMVYTFSPTFVKTKSEWHMGLFRNYYRQKQLVSGYKWLSGKELPAVCLKCPGLYIIAKGDENKLSLGLFNISPDEIERPEITLGESFASADFYNTKGTLEKETVTLSSPLPPYGFALVTLEKYKVQ